MYADNMTDSMDKAISETNRRRAIQHHYNEENGITPTTIKKAVRDLISISKRAENTTFTLDKDAESMSKKELEAVIKKMTKEMHTAAAELNFERAAELRDKILELKRELLKLE